MAYRNHFEYLHPSPCEYLLTRTRSCFTASYLTLVKNFPDPSEQAVAFSHGRVRSTRKSRIAMAGAIIAAAALLVAACSSPAGRVSLDAPPAATIPAQESPPERQSATPPVSTPAQESVKPGREAKATQVHAAFATRNLMKHLQALQKKLPMRPAETVPRGPPATKHPPVTLRNSCVTPGTSRCGRSSPIGMRTGK